MKKNILKSVNNASRSASLQDIILQHFNAEQLVDDIPAAQLEYRIAADVTIDDDCLDSIVTYALSVVNSSEATEEDKIYYANFKAVYKAEYNIKSDVESEPLCDFDLTAFGKLNGVYNTWPYWREMLQNISNKMELAPIVLPLLKIEELLGFLEGDTELQEIESAVESKEENQTD